MEARLRDMTRVHSDLGDGSTMSMMNQPLDNQIPSEGDDAVPTPPYDSSLPPVIVLTPCRFEVQTLSMALERSGVAVLSGGDELAAALAMLAALTRPCVALVDIGLLPGNLVNAMRELSAQAAQVRWIVFDRETIDLHMRQARFGGALAYVSRSASVEELLAAVRGAQQGRPWFPAATVPAAPLVRGVAPRTRSLGQIPTLRDCISPRETEVLGYLAQGLTVRQTAELIGLSPSTVDNHKSRLMRKLGLHKTVDLVRLALREGLVGP